MSTPPSIIYLGASRGVAYHAYVDLAKRRPELHHILLLRNVDGFKARSEFTNLPEDVVKRSTFVQGDAWNAENVKNLIEGAGPGLEAIVYTLGPHDHTSVFSKLLFGIIIEPKDAATRGLINVLQALASLPNPPKLVFNSSYGMGIKGLANLGWFMRKLYKYYLIEPHADKIAAELALIRALKTPSSSSTTTLFVPSTSELPPAVLSRTTFETLPASFLPPTNLLIVRPSALVDKPAQGYGSGSYKVVQDGVGVRSKMTINREEVGAFIAATLDVGKEGAEKWFGHQVVFQ